MPAKTIYVKEEDLPIFERAEELGGDSLSGIIATSLKRFVAAKEAEGKGIREHTLTVGVIRPQGAGCAENWFLWGSWLVANAWPDESAMTAAPTSLSTRPKQAKLSCTGAAGQNGREKTRCAITPF